MNIIFRITLDTNNLKRLWRSALMLALVAFICTSIPTAQAAPGDLDRTFVGFGADGIITETGLSMFTPLYDDYSKGMALQPDGKIVTVGQNGPNLTLFRYLSNGQRDETFSGDGKAEVPTLQGITLHFTDVALQPDGKIIVAGRTTEYYGDDDSDFLLVRLTSAGEPDTSFGQHHSGYVITDFYHKSDSALKVLVQPDGKIVAAGFAEVGGDEDFAVIRYNADGSPDYIFNGGKVTIGFGGDDRANDMALLKDGRLVLVGINKDYDVGTDHDFALASLKSDGTPDKTFGGGDGKLTTDFGGDEGANAMAIQADGRIVVLGNNSSDRKSHIARYMPTGDLDKSLDSDGKLTIPVDVLNDLALLPDGKMMVLGYHASPDNDNQFAFHRLNPNGTPDMSFDSDGKAFLDFDARDRGLDIALLADGRILGFGGSGPPGFYDKLHLVRLWPDGTTFDTGGQQTHGLAFPPGFQSGYREAVNGMALQPDGHFLVAGQLYDPDYAYSAAFLTRFSPDGLPQPFGTNGSARLGSGLFNAARAVAVQPDGKIVMAGYSAFNAQYTIMDFLVARFNANGSLDLSFGFNGSYLLDFMNGADSAAALALAPDGKIVVAGSVWNGVRYDWGVARFTNTGQPDPTFDSDGKVFFGFGLDNGLSAVAVQPDGKILAAGHAGRDFAVVRLTESGQIDSSFGQGGFTLTDLGGTDVINALALAPNGWIYAAGYRIQNGNTADIALAQYTPVGVLASCPDPANCRNWPTGTFFVDVGINDYAYALDLRSDNQLVAAGCINQHFAAVQVRTDGEPAALPFNTDFVGYPDCAKGVKFSGANKIVLAGDQNLYPFSNDSNIALARFETTVDTTAPPPPPTPAPNPNPTVKLVYLPIIVR